MSDYLLAGVRRRPGMRARPHGPYATALLPRAERDRLTATTADALEVLRAGAWTPQRSRDRFVLTVLDGQAVHRLVEAPQQVHGQGPVQDLFKLVWHVDAPMLSAAQALAELCDLVVAAHPGLDGRGFLLALGEQAAGVTPGARGWGDLAVGGHNVLLGEGFRAELEDGSGRQVRHFAGTAAVAGRIGVRATRVLSRVRGDLPGTADDRLSQEALALAGLLRSGRLAPAGAGGWVREHVLAPEASTDPSPEAPSSTWSP